MIRQEKRLTTLKDLKRLGKERYGFAEAFCGAGGMSLGLIRAGFNPLFAFDLDERSVETYATQVDPNCRVADAREMNGKEILKASGVKKKELPIFAGGPPCQGFSKQKRGAHLGDDRNTLVLEFSRLVSETKPRFFLFENVAIFGQKRGEKFVREIEDRLKDYELQYSLLNCANFGLAQTRERFVIVGKRRDQKVKLRMPVPRSRRWKTVGEILKGLPEPPNDYSEHPKFSNHQNARVTPINIERFSHVPQGGGWQDIPEPLRLECHKRVDPKSGGWPDVYGRLRWDGQCPTITGGFDNFSRGRYGHPLKDRPITPREAARIQGFPDSHVFRGTRGAVRSQIGNAVPPPMAEAVGLEILRSLLSEDGVISDMVFDLPNGRVNGHIL